MLSRVVLLTAILSVAVPASAAATLAAPDAAPAHALTADDARAWLDGFMREAIEQGDIAGAVAAIVKDGAPLVEAGYGYADLTSRKSVDPAGTLFRMGSVSKLFTWTAVMQLVEQGKLDLDTDVNRYLDFTIPARDGTPVTLRNLMTHTAGFEERLSGLIGVEGARVVPLGEFVKTYVPVRIFAPGTTPAYSNYGAALAGYIVARVSGESFDDYMDQHVLGPLEMHDSSFRQPVPARLAARLSKGYSVASLPSRPGEIVGPAPAGSLVSSGADMANFMIAHLQNGRFGTQRILSAATAQEMHDTALTLLPPLDRMLLGFYEDTYNGHRVIAHGGDTQWFHSDLHLFIDEGVGLFVAFNSTGKDAAVHVVRSNLFHQFADRYFPGPTPDGSVEAATAAAHAHAIAGRYQASRRVASRFLSLLYLFGETQVIDEGDGTIRVSNATSPSGVPYRWREIAPWVWRQVGGKQLLAAQAAEGQVTRFSFGESAPYDVFDRAPWWQSAGWLVPALLAALGVLALQALAWPVIVGIRRHYRVPPEESSMVRARRRIRLASAVVALLFAGWLALVFTMTSVLTLIDTLGPWSVLLQFLSPVVFLGGAVLGLSNALLVLRSGRGRLAKLWSLVLAVAFLVVLWVAFICNLISFRTGF
jgi:CubicO group peptidase (beta-lactamase class C family)